MSHQGADAILEFLKSPQNKPLRDLIELAASEDPEALKYVEFIQEEIGKKFKSVDDSGGGALESTHLSIKLDAKDGQEGIRAVDPDMIYYFNEFGLLKNEKKDDNTLDYEQYEKIGQQLELYMFHILIHKYKFKAKVIGNSNIAKKKKMKLTDYQYKTLLFSPKFEQADTVVIIIPPIRGCISYKALAIDEGLSYGTLLPYIEKILSWNPKPVKKKKKGSDALKKGSDSLKKGKADKKKDKEQKEEVHDEKKASNEPVRRWGILIMDPQGKDTNSNKYSIIKIYDKWLSKRIPSVGLFGFHPHKAEPAHRRTGSDESIASTLSAAPGSGPKSKAEIKNLFFLGCLNNGELISHLMHRRGQSVANVTKGCLFLGADDPYDANDATKEIYSKCGVNYLNSTLPRETVIEGKKVNGDPYIIRRKSAGNPRYCVQSACPSIIKFLKDALIEKEMEDIDEEDEQKTEAD